VILTDDDKINRGWKPEEFFKTGEDEIADVLRIMNTGNASLLTKGLSLASINCWHVRVNIRQQKQNPSVARCTRTFSGASGATGGTFIQSGRWDSSITPKTSAAPLEYLRSGFQVRGLILFPIPFPSQAVFQV
jgi:hypothetical protein